MQDDEKKAFCQQYLLYLSVNNSMRKIITAVLALAMLTLLMDTQDTFRRKKKRCKTRNKTRVEMGWM